MGLAQLVEHLTEEWEVVGLIPGAGPAVQYSQIKCFFFLAVSLQILWSLLHLMTELFDLRMFSHNG